MSGIRISTSADGAEPVQTRSVDDFYYFRDSIHAALEQGEFGSRFPTFLKRFEPDEWKPEELDQLHEELKDIAAAFRKMAPEPPDSNWQGRAHGCASLYDVYVDDRGQPLLGGLIALCAAARKAGQPIALEDAPDRAVNVAPPTDSTAGSQTREPGGTGGAAPPPACPQCGGTPATPPHVIRVDSVKLSGSATVFSFHLCQACDGYVLTRGRVRPAGGGHDPIVLGGVIPRAMGDSDVLRIRTCPRPLDTGCRCEAHDHFVEMAEFMEYKDAKRRAAGEHPDAPVVRTAADVMTDPDFVKGVVEAMAFGERRAAEQRPAEDVPAPEGSSRGWLIAWVVIIVTIVGMAVAVLLKMSAPPPR